eukprot:gene18958-22653_t
MEVQTFVQDSNSKDQWNAPVAGRTDSLELSSGKRGETGFEVPLDFNGAQEIPRSHDVKAVPSPSSSLPGTRVNGVGSPTRPSPDEKSLQPQHCAGHRRLRISLKHAGLSSQAALERAIGIV